MEYKDIEYNEINLPDILREHVRDMVLNYIKEISFVIHLKIYAALPYHSVFFLLSISFFLENLVMHSKELCDIQYL